MQIRVIIKKYKFSFIALLLVLSFICSPISNTLQVNRVEAGSAVVVVGGMGTIQETLSAVANKLVAFATQGLNYKELVLDPLVWILINKILEQMAADTIKWINSGFSGNPAFVQDFGGFLTKVGDQTVGDFLKGTDLAFVCSPFNLDIKMALDLQYAKSRNFETDTAACTLTGAQQNIDKFLNGSFFAKGWQGWFEMNSNPMNNRFGAIAVAQQELSVRIGNAKYTEKSFLDWGQGLFSLKECSDYVVDQNGQSQCVNWATLTPGTAIENQLNSALDIPKGRLTVADEFNEVLSALFGQLVNTIFQSGAGLLGSTDPGSGVGGYNSIFDDVNDASQNSSGDALTEIRAAISLEQKIIQMSNTLMQPFINALNYKDNTYGDANQCHSGNFPANSTLDKAYQQALSETNAMIAKANSNLISLNDILARLQAATTEDEKNALAEEFLKLKAGGTLHTEIDIALLKTHIDTSLPQLQTDFNRFTGQVDNACNDPGAGGNWGCGLQDCGGGGP